MDPEIKRQEVRRRVEKLRKRWIAGEISVEEFGNGFIATFTEFYPLTSRQVLDVMIDELEKILEEEGGDTDVGPGGP